MEVNGFVEVVIIVLVGGEVNGFVEVAYNYEILCCDIAFLRIRRFLSDFSDLRN